MQKQTEQKTAVEWFVKKFSTELIGEIPLHRWDEIRSAVIQAKELEKHQHGDTWDAAIKAHDDRGHVHARSLVDFDEYFEEQFKK